MTMTSPALPTPAASPDSRLTTLNRLTGLRRRVPTVILFAAVSFSGWTVDYVLVLILNSLTDSVLYAVVGARFVSCTLGFLLNRRLFRAAPETFWRSAGGYAAVQGGGGRPRRTPASPSSPVPERPCGWPRCSWTPRSSSSTTWPSPVSSTGPPRRPSRQSWCPPWHRRPDLIRRTPPLIDGDQGRGCVSAVMVSGECRVRTGRRA